MSMMTSFLNFCRKSIASRATQTAASGSSPLTWKIGAPIIFATSVQYSEDRESDGEVVKPIWLLTMMWMVPPVRYPRSSARFSVSATTPWPAKAASPCSISGTTEKSSEPSAPRSMSSRSCLARTMPSRTGSTASRCDGLATSDTVDVVVAEHLHVVAVGAEVVLHVAGAVRLRRVQVALELAEDLRVRLADDVGQHVEPAAVRHADDDLVERVFGGLVDHGVHHRDDGLGAFERESLLPNVFGLQERLERLGGVELGQDVLLLATVGFSCLTSTRSSQPLLLVGFQDVGVLDADVAAVRVAQQAESTSRSFLYSAPAKPLTLNTRSRSHSVSPWVSDVEVGVAAEPGLVQSQRVDVGHQVAAVAVGRDQFDDARVLVDDRVRVVGAPPHRLVRDAELAEDLVEEVVGEQQFVDGAQEVAGLRALDDAVVVGRGERDQLAEAQSRRSAPRWRPGTRRGTPSRRRR